MLAKQVRGVIAVAAAEASAEQALAEGETVTIYTAVGAAREAMAAASVAKKLASLRRNCHVAVASSVHGCGRTRATASTEQLSARPAAPVPPWQLHASALRR